MTKLNELVNNNLQFELSVKIMEQVETLLEKGLIPTNQVEYVLASAWDAILSNVRDVNDEQEERQELSIQDLYARVETLEHSMWEESHNTETQLPKEKDSIKLKCMKDDNKQCGKELKNSFLVSNFLSTIGNPEILRMKVSGIDSDGGGPLLLKVPKDVDFQKWLDEMNDKVKRGR
jgi:hypothetical protein